MPPKYRLNNVILLPTKAYAAYATILSLIELEPQQFHQKLLVPRVLSCTTPNLNCLNSQALGTTICSSTSFCSSDPSSSQLFQPGSWRVRAHLWNGSKGQSSSSSELATFSGSFCSFRAKNCTT